MKYKWLVIALIVIGVLAALYFGARNYARSILYQPTHEVVAPTLAQNSSTQRRSIRSARLVES